MSLGRVREMSPITAATQALLDRPEVELISELGQARDDHPVAVEILRVLTYRRTKQQTEASAAVLHATEKQAAAGDALVHATKGLVEATGRLARATWALAGMTVLLVLAAAVQAYLMFKGAT
jgi:predicted GTPase